jgi:hypothetical protein
MHQAPWAQWLTTSLPSKNDKINSKASQSCPGARLIFTSWFQSYRRDTAVLCNTGASRPFEHHRKAQSYWDFGG